MAIHKKKNLFEGTGESTGFFYMVKAYAMGLISVLLIVLKYGVAFASIVIM